MESAPAALELTLCGTNSSLSPSAKLELGSSVCLSNSDLSCCHPVVPNDYAVTAGVLCSFVAIFGSLGNMLTLLALPYARKRATDPYSPLKSSATILVVSLAMCDLLYCMVNLPVFALQYWNRGWHHGPVLCWIAAFLRHLLAFASFMSLAAIAINRCLAVWSQTTCDVLFGWRGVPAIICVWLMALVFCSPGLFKVYGQFGYNMESGQCDMAPVSGRNGHTLMVSLAVLLPLATMVTCSCLIVVRLRQISTPIINFHDVGSSTKEFLQRRDHRLTRLCFVLCGAFLFLVGPLALCKACGFRYEPWSWIQLSLNALYWHHYAANVCIYALRNSCFQKAYGTFLKEVVFLPFAKYTLRRGPSLASERTNSTVFTISINETSY